MPERGYNHPMNANPTPAPNQHPMRFDDIRTLVQHDMDATNQVIRAELHSDVTLIEQISHYIIEAGGKRLRPMLVLLAGGCVGGIQSSHHQLAAIIEFIHTATLLHDDVVDESDLRRGRATANASFGNAASVLVGDFLYSRSFQMMVAQQRLDIMDLLADTTNQIAEGEVLQLLHVRNPDVNEAAYLKVIERKTAVLFAAATRLGAMANDADAATCDALQQYGHQLGLAFQIADDVLDYTADEAALGKHAGDDLAEGKATLPVIHALQHCDDATRQKLMTIIREGDLNGLPMMLDAIHTHGSIDYARQRAQHFVAQAQKHLAHLPANPCRDALHALATYALNRSH